jgi:ornithine carbamoyltransferase
MGSETVSVIACDPSTVHDQVASVQRHPGSLLTSLDIDKEQFLAPSLHKVETELGKRLLAQFGLEGAEVTNGVFDSQRSLVFDQAENRMHNKAVIVTALGG